MIDAYEYFDMGYCYHYVDCSLSASLISIIVSINAEDGISGLQIFGNFPFKTISCKNN
jgi:hypothetical protein